MREVTLGAFAHQDLPFEKLVEELQPERQLSHSPLFQILYVFQNTPNDEDRQPLPGLTISGRESEDLGAQFDITLILSDEADGRLKASFYYSTALFDATTIERLWSHMAALIVGAVAAPEARRLGAARARRGRARGAAAAGERPGGAGEPGAGARDAGGRAAAVGRRAAGVPALAPPRVHDPLGVRLPGRAAADLLGQAGPAGAAGARDGGPGLEVYVPPRTPVEEALAAILAELLKRERVGVESNLFELGGHSLMVMQLIGRIREAFGAELTVQNVFETPTVAGLAALVDTWRWAAAPPVQVLAAAGGLEGELEMEEMEL